ncbi:MAG TPA: glycosyltransferase family A protein [Baekduia sp.]
MPGRPRPRRIAPAADDATVPRRTVAVIVPTYNYAHLLAGCVRTVLDQEGVDVRVRIVDDQSPDDSAAVAAALVAADPDRVALHRNTTNQGLIRSANDGLAWAAEIGSDFVVLLSADDFLAPGALRRAVAIMEAEPGVGMVYGRAPYFREDSPFPDTGGAWTGTDVWAGRDWVDLRCRVGHNCISSPEVVVRTAVQQAIGGYDERCTHASDLNMWLRVGAISDIAYVRGVPQAVYRVHGSSMLRAEHSAMRDLDERWKAFSSFFAGAGGSVVGAARLRERAGRALARQALWRASRAYDRDLVSGDGALPVDALVAFALTVYPDARRLREYHGLRTRRALGAGRSRYFLPFLATGAAHRLRSLRFNRIAARDGI